MFYSFLPMEKALKLKERTIKTWFFLKRWQKSDVSWCERKFFIIVKALPCLVLYEK